MHRLSRLTTGLTIGISLSIAALAVPAVAHGANSSDYVVRSGDSLSGIANRFDVRLSDLLAANDLRVTSVIFPGQHLTVPGAAAGPAASTTGGNYTIRSGDSLFAIAHRHGVRLADLLSANNLQATSMIFPGNRLTIPGGATAATPAATAGNYTIKPGDSLFAIALRNHVSLPALLAANNLQETSVIFPGQRLTIPGGTASAPAPAQTSSAANYTVKSGDSLGAIAARHDVSLTAVLTANNLAITSVIHPGQRLVVPGASASQPSSSSNAIDRVVNFAVAQVGKPYKFFTKGPSTFDCSGLTLAAYAQAGVSLVHHSASQARQGRPVDFYNDAIRAGDLVFMSTRGGPGINHVGIAISSTRMVQARRPGVPVQITAVPPDSMILAVRRYITG